MYEKTLKYDARVDSTQLAPHFARSLRSARASDVRVIEDRVVFKGGIFRLVTNWNVLVPFGHGEIQIDSERRTIRYRLSFAQLLTIATAWIIVAGVMILSGKVSERPQVIAFLLVVWALVVGLSLLIGVPRFDNFIRESLSTAPRLTSQSTGVEDGRQH